MTVKTQPELTSQDYLAIERNAEQKSEYLNGEMFAMGGASPAHNLIVTNTVRELSTQLKARPCKVYANDMRVKVSLTGLYTYPDVTVVCGEERFDDAQKDTLLNPTVIVEVLSDSTEGYDRGKKFEHYRRLKSLQHYVLIAQKNLHVEGYQRQQNNQWLLSETNDLRDTIQLTAIKCRLALAEIYDKVLL